MIGSDLTGFDLSGFSRREILDGIAAVHRDRERRHRERETPRETLLRHLATMESQRDTIDIAIKRVRKMLDEMDP